MRASKEESTAKKTMNSNSSIDKSFKNSNFENNTINDESQTPSDPIPSTSPTPPTHPWFRSPNQDSNLMQQIFLQQQRSIVHQQTTLQIQALLQELAPAISEDLFCEDIERDLVCTPSLPPSKINLVKSIQQIGRVQLQWQLTGGTLELPTHGAKITLKL